MYVSRAIDYQPIQVPLLFPMHAGIGSTPLELIQDWLIDGHATVWVSHLYFPFKNINYNLALKNCQMSTKKQTALRHIR